MDVNQWVKNGKHFKVHYKMFGNDIRELRKSTVRTEKVRH